VTDDEIVELVGHLKASPLTNHLTLRAARAIEQLAAKADLVTECEQKVARLRSQLAGSN
jgi:hypothetical protein